MSSSLTTYVKLLDWCSFYYLKLSIPLNFLKFLCFCAHTLYWSITFWFGGELQFIDFFLTYYLSWSSGSNKTLCSHCKGREAELYCKTVANGAYDLIPSFSLYSLLISVLTFGSFEFLQFQSLRHFLGSCGHNVRSARVPFTKMFFVQGMACFSPLPSPPSSLPHRTPHHHGYTHTSLNIQKVAGSCPLSFCQLSCYLFSCIYWMLADVLLYLIMYSSPNIVFFFPLVVIAPYSIGERKHKRTWAKPKFS